MSPKPDFHQVMTRKVGLGADLVRGISPSQDIGGASPEMSDDRWGRLAEEARALQHAALEIAATADQPDSPKGGAALRERIASNPARLRSLANALASHSGELIVAAQRHDIARSRELVAQLDADCRSCHRELRDTGADTDASRNAT